MSYSEYTLERAVRTLGLKPHGEALFAGVTPEPAPSWLTETLKRNTPLALMSEKSRSESIVFPVLAAVREIAGDRVAVFSGPRLDVDADRGLVGECDFLLAVTESVLPVRAPIVAVAEAKKGDIEQSLGQCVAQMAGAQMFNRAAGEPPRPVFGCVTTGDAWQFLRLVDSELTTDTRRYYLTELPAVLGAFREIVARCTA